MAIYPPPVALVVGNAGEIPFVGEGQFASSPWFKWDAVMQTLLIGDPNSLETPKIQSGNRQGFSVSGVDAALGSGDAGGPLRLRGGAGDGVGAGNSVTLTSGSGGDSGKSGDISIAVPISNGANAGGSIEIEAGTAGSDGGAGGSLNITSGSAAGAGANAGGDIVLSLGTGVGAGRNGLIIIGGTIPTADPLVHGALWSNAGVLTISVA